MNGLAIFDGENWTVYDTRSWNWRNRITRISFDKLENVWIGTDGGGIARFDGVNWTIYSTSNSELPYDRVHNSPVIDRDENLWIGTSLGMAKFDGENWTVYKPSNSGLPCYWIWSIAIVYSWLGWR